MAGIIGIKPGISMEPPPRWRSARGCS